MERSASSSEFDEGVTTIFVSPVASSFDDGIIQMVCWVCILVYVGLGISMSYRVIIIIAVAVVVVYFIYM